MESTVTRILVFVFLLMALTLPSAFAQPPDTLWTRIFGTADIDRGDCVQQTSDGGYIVAGAWDRNLWSPWNSYLYLLKTDASGNEEWVRFLGGEQTYEGFSIQQTTDGGYIIAGETGYTYHYYVYLVKTDANGNTMWTRTFGGDNYDSGRSVQQTSDGGYIITGMTASYGAGNGDVYLIKTDSSGIEEWHQTFGGTNPDEGYSVQQTSDGGYIIAGSSYCFGTGDPDAYIIKTDTSGIEEWYQVYGGPTEDFGYSIQQTTDGGYIMAGMTTGYGELNGDVYLIKMDASGTVQWIRHPGGDYADQAWDVKQTDDRGYIVVGYTESFGAGMYDVYVIKFDANGNEDWQQTIGGSGNDEGNCIQQTAGGGYIITGYTESWGAGLGDVWLLRLGFPGPQIEVSVDSLFFPETVVGDTTSLPLIIHNTGTSDLIIYDIYTGQPDVFSTDWIVDDSLIAPGSILEIEVYFYPDDSVTFVDDLFIENNDELVLVYLEGDGMPPSGVEVHSEVAPLHFVLYQPYPNPFNPSTTISYQVPITGNVSISIYNLLGQKITTIADHQATPGSYSTIWNAGDLPSGIYFCKMEAGNFTQTKKLLLLK